jgi:homoaconitase/3-isopropylmalate dehydratase large subunit
MIRMPLKSHRDPLPALTPEQGALADSLRHDVQKLATVIGERNVFKPDGLRAATAFVEGEFVRAGYKVVRQSYEAHGELCHNLEVEIPGKTRPGEIVVVGAHYDSVSGCVGANDNGSGMAAVMVTDTAPFRYTFYHTTEDTADKLDYDRMARVVAGIDLVLQELVANDRLGG